MTGCAETYTPETETVAQPISVEAAAKLHGRAGVEFVDPRPKDFIAKTTGIIPGARAISLEAIEAGDLPPAFDDRSIHVVASCLGGPMGAQAAAAFAKLGFAKVSFVEGGTSAWVDAGHPTNR